MSLLAPLYFLGALAVSLPILFHLIRRQPKGQVEFSSLMFLRPTPPRLTRRSRLDNWPLLLIRALALLLIAAAFARPFLRSEILADAELPGRRLVLMMDTSASMQRADLWQQALRHADAAVAELQPADRLAIVSFDSVPKTIVEFDPSEQLTTAQRKSEARRAVRSLKPSWEHTELGQAISFAGDMAVHYEPEEKLSLYSDNGAAESETVADSPEAGPAQLILISDLQSGSEIESLQRYAWPKNLKLDVKRVAPSQRTNASATVLTAATSDEAADDRLRVRVTNSADADRSSFSLKWGSKDASPGTEFPVQVPPGESRILRMPPPEPGVTELLLQGDEHPFDNSWFVVSPEPVIQKLGYLGPSDADARSSLLYYLERLPLDTSWRKVQIEAFDGSQLAEPPDVSDVPLLVIGQPLDTAVTDTLGQYVQQGGQVLFVLNRDDPQRTDGQTEWQAWEKTVNDLAGSSLRFQEAVINDYVMWSRIDFEDALFAPLADPKFNDFTQVRFWNHRAVENVTDPWRTVAHFDNDHPAVMRADRGKGEIVLMATGWQPTSSQLAMSTKFIPLMFNLFDKKGLESNEVAYRVGEPIAYSPGEEATIVGPDGTQSPYRTEADLGVIDRPGVYRYRDGETTHRFAVNLKESESRTSTLGDDQLERFGAQIGQSLTVAERREQQRQLRDRELESSQKLWQWLLLAALGLLALETILGRRWSHESRTAATPQLTTEN